MINTNMRTYSYFTLGLNEYGQEVVSNSASGSVKMAIYATGQSVQDNVLYHNAQYMGLTHDKHVSDSWVIDYEGTKLKVLYVSSQGRFKQVFMAKVG